MATDDRDFDGGGYEGRRDSTRSADGQSARAVSNTTGEYSIDRAREAFDANLGGGRGDYGSDYGSSAYGGILEGGGSLGRSLSDDDYDRAGGSGRGRRSASTRAAEGAAAGVGVGLALLGGIGIGAALIDLLDPEQGRRRRALVRDKVTSAANKAGDTVGKTSRDLANRAQGVIAGAGNLLPSRGDAGGGQQQGQEATTQGGQGAGAATAS